MKTDKQKIADALADADMKCEGANYHDRIGLAQRVYDAVSPACHKSDHVVLAKKIAKAITDDL